MKKQSTKKLAFNKVVVTELNRSEMNIVGGGITTTSTVGPMTVITGMTISCSYCISSSNGNFTQIEY